MAPSRSTRSHHASYADIVSGSSLHALELPPSANPPGIVSGTQHAIGQPSRQPPMPSPQPHPTSSPPVSHPRQQPPFRPTSISTSNQRTKLPISGAPAVQSNAATPSWIRPSTRQTSTPSPLPSHLPLPLSPPPLVPEAGASATRNPSCSQPNAPPAAIPAASPYPPSYSQPCGPHPSSYPYPYPYPYGYMWPHGPFGPHCTNHTPHPSGSQLVDATTVSPAQGMATHRNPAGRLPTVALGDAQLHQQHQHPLPPLVPRDQWPHCLVQSWTPVEVLDSQYLTQAQGPPITRSSSTSTPPPLPQTAVHCTAPLVASEWLLAGGLDKLQVKGKGPDVIRHRLSDAPKAVSRASSTFFRYGKYGTGCRTLLTSTCLRCISQA